MCGVNIKKGDQIKIISGNDKGRVGKVMAVFGARGAISVEGINMKKKHMRPRRQGERGEIIMMPAFFRASRAMLVCSSCGKPTRTGTRRDGGRGVRVCKKCGAEM